MTEEIKEIFRRMNDLIEHQFDKEYHTECDLFKDIQDLLDYITNLQQNYEGVIKQRNDISKNATETIEKLLGDKKNLQQENEDFKTIIKQYVDIVLHDKKEKDRLQQENERLKEENKHIFSKVNDDELLISNTMNYAEAQDYKSRCKKANDFIDNYDVFKEFSFPLMKRDIENQIKSSIDYEFNSTFRKNLKNILNGSDKK